MYNLAKGAIHSPVVTRPSRSPRIRALINQSLCLYLLLCVWLGPAHTMSLLILVMIVVTWRALSRRWPILNVMLIGFIRGLMGR